MILAMAPQQRVVGLDEAARDQLRGAVPGVAVVVVGTEGVRLERAFGAADLDRREDMTSKTFCNWFSMTKLVTATAVAQLADEGRLDLDAPVVDSYEPLAGLRPAERAVAITARHLLAHSSGLGNPLPLRWVHPADRPGPDRARFVTRLLERHRRVRFVPGDKAAYTNLGYLVLGELITAVSGEPFEDYVRAHVLEPLKMMSTGFTISDSARWATPYQRRFSPMGALMPALIPRDIRGPRHGRFRALRHFYVDGAAYGGLVGPPCDAARFLQAHVRDGELDGARILSIDAARTMRTMVAHGRTIDVGMGWFRRGRVRSADFMEHLGGGAGYWTCMRIYPEVGVGAVVMGNATTFNHHAIVNAALREMHASS
jgi:CubicO group peptidase (beta-lactamase class C family)